MHASSSAEQGHVLKRALLAPKHGLHSGSTLMAWIGVASNGEPVSLNTAFFSRILIDPFAILAVIFDVHAPLAPDDAGDGTVMTSRKPTVLRKSNEAMTVSHLVPLRRMEIVDPSRHLLLVGIRHHT